MKSERNIVGRLLGLALSIFSFQFSFANDTLVMADTLITTDTLVMADTTVVTDTLVTADTIAAKRDSTHMPRVPEKKIPIYQGTMVKLDIASPAVIAGISRGTLQHYEIAANVRLKDRFYPTLEIGYAGGHTQNDSIAYNGHGGFFRVGVDINPLRKHPDSPHALLVGVRLGTSMQNWQHTTQATGGFRADCWGEIALGCQVEIVNGRKSKIESQKRMAFYMGWMGRIKCMFTRQAEGMPAEQQAPLYVPGFGYRDNIGWGLNYYVGWKF